MTEADAKTKWCNYATAPMETSGVGIGISISRNADGTPATATLCLASGCMAWRWQNQTLGQGYCGESGGKGAP